MVTAYDRGITHKEASDFSYGLNQTLRKMETCGKPVAVAINGLALGGGLEVCLACHYRVLANDTGAVLGFPGSQYRPAAWRRRHAENTTPDRFPQRGNHGSAVPQPETRTGT